MARSSNWLACLAFLLSLLDLSAYRTEAHPLQQLTRLALVLSPLCPGARRATEELPGGSFLGIVGDARLALVHNTCKDVHQNACKREKADTCIWDWDEAAAKHVCKPKTCSNLYGSDCKELPDQCLWKWDAATGSGECLNKAAPAKKPELKDNPCKDLQGTQCRANSEVCTWDWDKQTSTGNCRPKTCSGIKGTDCRDLSSQCVWKWDQETQTGECQDLHKAPETSPTEAVSAKLKDNTCKGLKGTVCRGKSEDCAWDWSKQTNSGNCRPKTCVGIKGTDCKELTSQCTWKWHQDTNTGECLDLEKAPETTSTEAVSAKLKDNTCKGLKGTVCRGKSEDCAWDWNKQTNSGNCRPKTCAGIKGSDCKELTSQCTWKWNKDTNTGECLDLEKAPETTTSTSTSVAIAKLKDNECKGLKGTLCKGKSEDCAWDWNGQTNTGNCRPKTCVGIKGTDCKELTSQCTWKWHQDTNTGECLNLEKAPEITTSTTTSVASAKLKDNTCKGLKGTLCKGKSEDCAWDWNAQTNTGNCRPKTCVGIKGTDCKELTSQCTWKWHQDTNTGECLDLEKAPETTTSTTTSAAIAKLKDNTCKGLKGTLCQGKSEDCAWDWDAQTSTGNCRPKTCVGIKGTDCKELTSQCTWKWHQDTNTGECLDLEKPAASTKGDPSLALMHNTCKDVNRSACLEKRDTCTWVPEDWDATELKYVCRPRRCYNLYGSDCRELPDQCFWEWDEATSSGECMNKAKDNPCNSSQGLGRYELLEHSERLLLRLLWCRVREQICTWDNHTDDCRPKTCTGIRVSDCKELTSQCTWKWIQEPKTGRCLNLPKATTAAESTNPCKGLKRGGCPWYSRGRCHWDSSTGICRPKNCTGIKGSDCEELTGQCSWKWNKDTDTGECLDLPKAAETTTTTTVANAPMRDNPCKDLKGSVCTGKSEVCVWDWDKQTSSGNCRPKTCAGIKGTHCKELSSQCSWEWDKETNTGKCLDVAQAPPTQPKGSACLGLIEGKCNIPECKWRPESGGCTPRTCVGLKGTHCRSFPHQCTWKWDAEANAGECVDSIISTTVTTTSSGSRAMWLVSVLLVSAFVTIGLPVL